MNLNKGFLGGRLTREPEARNFNSGSCVCNFGIAINWKKRTGNGYEDQTTFVDVECWQQTAEFVRDYLHKGDPVLVEYHLVLDQWQDRETGAKRQKLKVVAERVQSCKSRQDAGNGYQAAKNGEQQQDPYQYNYNRMNQAPTPAPTPPPFPVDAPAPPDNGVYDVAPDSIDDIPF